MHLDPAMPMIVGALFVILFLGLLMRILHQPHVVAYLVAGVLLGPFGIGLITDRVLLDRLGAFGVVLLLFFIGMEVSPRQLLASWRQAFLGTFAQVAASVAVAWGLGAWLDWPLPRVVLVGFALSLSSTAVALSYLQERGQMESRIGQNVLAVLLAQDVAIVPMMILIGVLGGGGIDAHTLTLQGIGTLVILSILVWLTVAKQVKLPLGKRLREDHELQIFVAFILCFGLAALTGFFELSSALGAFVGGMVVGTARESQWVHHRLESFRVVFVALFFVSIGLLVDLDFLRKAAPKILLLVVAVLVINTIINFSIFRALGESKGESLYSAALLSQVGELSFLLAAVGVQTQLISEVGYQTTVAVIAVSLLLSPAWISLMRRWSDHALFKSG